MKFHLPDIGESMVTDHQRTCCRHMEVEPYGSQINFMKSRQVLRGYARGHPALTYSEQNKTKILQNGTYND